MKATVLLFLSFSFLLPTSVLGGWRSWFRKEVDSALRNFDGSLLSNFEIDIFGRRLLGRDAVVEVTSLRDGIVELYVTIDGGTPWNTKCDLGVVEGKEHLQEGGIYTVKTTASDIDCKTIDVKAAPYVDMSLHFTPTTDKYTIDGVKTKCCCVGGRKNNVCKVVPTQGYLSKFLQIAKRELFNFWNPLSSANFFSIPKLVFKNKNGCGMLVGKDWHNHKHRSLPNAKCLAKRSIYTLPFSEGASDEEKEAVYREYLDRITNSQRAPWYSTEVPYADRKSISEISEKWLASLKLDRDDQKRIDAAVEEVALDQQVLDSFGVKLTYDEHPETLSEDRFPLKFMVRFLTLGAEPEDEKL